MKRYKNKKFKGLIRYGQARLKMYRNGYDTLNKLYNKGVYTFNEKLEALSAFNRNFRKCSI
jgi:hypothetical protein